MSREINEKPAAIDPKAVEQPRKDEADRNLSDEQLAELSGGLNPQPLPPRSR